MDGGNSATDGQQNATASSQSIPHKRPLEAVAEAPTVAIVSQGPPVPESDEHTQKRAKTGEAPQTTEPVKDSRTLGVAPVKKEYLIKEPSSDTRDDDVDDDEAEGRGHGDGGDRGGGGRKKGKNKGGQNKERTFGRSRDAIPLCNSVATANEFSPKQCRQGDRCRFIHDLRKYLAEGRREDLTTFEGKCPVFAAHGRCPSGWKCRFVKSHMKEVEHEDGRKELVLIEEAKPSNGTPLAVVEGEAKDGGENSEKTASGGNNNQTPAVDEDDDARPDVVNVISSNDKYNLTRRKTVLDKSEAYIKWLTQEMDVIKKIYGNHKDLSYNYYGKDDNEENGESKEAPKEEENETAEELRAQFIDPPFLPSEKRKIYFGPETPTLAPLTTQGNLPFRRLCVDLGCQFTYSEMAMCMELVTGKQPEWALLKAHTSEISPPQFRPERHDEYTEIYRHKPYIVHDYDNSRDLKFGVQVAATQPWMAIKATEAMTRLLPPQHLRLIDMNCGCPIDMVYKSGGGSGLLESHNKLERMIRGMNAVSGEVPITAKLRIGVKDNAPCAPRVIERLAFGGIEARERLGAPGCAAITLHGRTRNQRYRKPADWSYIAECAELVKKYNATRDEITDTVREPDPRTQSNAYQGRNHIYFLGNGDCYSHVQYRDQIVQSGVDSVMIGRGALVKPWLFEEIEKGQYLDKSATERLAYIEKFARYGMDCWGTDEFGLGMTRRFLLEYMGFASRYLPIGLLEYLPPSLSDRPPQYRSRNELEGLLASRNYKDWIKISEMFLGPAHPDFKFVPKHKSSSYEETQG